MFKTHFKGFLDLFMKNIFLPTPKFSAKNQAAPPIKTAKNQAPPPTKTAKNLVPPPRKPPTPPQWGLLNGPLYRNDVVSFQL